MNAPSPTPRPWQRWPDLFWLIPILAIALTLRLLAWRWLEQAPLGGDEQEYLARALELLQQRRYTELNFMRPPIYTLFLAGSIYLFDSLIQNLRLIQAIISALTIIPAYGLLRTIATPQAARLATLLIALDYTLAMTATELLSETLFLFGLFTTLWIVFHAANQRRTHWFILSGVAIALLALIRSVALPLIPLSMLLILSGPASTTLRQRTRHALIIAAAAACTIAPWSIRNTLTYGGFILIDTTGAENLWLDNDPRGREYVKRILYDLGDDRLARQQLASREGLSQIRQHPEWFLAKATREAGRFFSLQHTDDMHTRRAIWVSSAELWLRLLLGDALWLFMLLGGLVGMWLPTWRSSDPRLLLAPWACYVFATGCLFHVEMRYRLPILAALVPCIAIGLSSWQSRRFERSPQPHQPIIRQPAMLLRLCGLLACLGLIGGLSLTHASYPQLASTLLSKHLALAAAEEALNRNDTAAAKQTATNALQSDPTSALARITLAQVALRQQQPERAIELLDQALQAVPDHPRAHILRGLIARTTGNLDQARADLAAETTTREDTQTWAWENLPSATILPTALTLGQGLDLGFVQGWHAAETGGGRWSRTSATIRLAAPNSPSTLRIRASAPRPAGSLPAQVTISLNGQPITTVTIATSISTLELPLPPAAYNQPALIIRFATNTIRPRDFDRTTTDGRQIGVLVESLTIIPTP
jgi:4-amino-4-deoxy-L-arabinose transferase-like glycosyltransferase